MEVPNSVSDIIMTVCAAIEFALKQNKIAKSPDGSDSQPGMQNTMKTPLPLARHEKILAELLLHKDAE